eukprot:comp21703_c0_seq1/m.48284 comp21703_c0_seq1/g.48284  ORF comp21703_c0_seq1/g.48284 comp21703_c0_seq1/m.48284 type:complete len:338 (-) comp21703_c0_seq1:684-1697(-)
MGRRSFSVQCLCWIYSVFTGAQCSTRTRSLCLWDVVCWSWIIINHRRSGTAVWSTQGEVSDGRNGCNSRGILGVSCVSRAVHSRQYQRRSIVPRVSVLRWPLCVAQCRVHPGKHPQLAPKEKAPADNKESPCCCQTPEQMARRRRWHGQLAQGFKQHPRRTRRCKEPRLAARPVDRRHGQRRCSAVSDGIGDIQRHRSAHADTVDQRDPRAHKLECRPALVGALRGPGRTRKGDHCRIADEVRRVCALCGLLCARVAQQRVLPGHAQRPDSRALSAGLCKQRPCACLQLPEMVCAHVWSACADHSAIRHVDCHKNPPLCALCHHSPVFHHPACHLAL